METWKEIPGYYKRYSASSLGRIKSLKRKVKSKDGYRGVNERIMKLKKVTSGYLAVQLGWRGRMELVHRLIASSFLGCPEKGMQTNHINGIKTDNRIENLEWSTRSENQKHAYRLGLQKGFALSGKFAPNAKKVYRYDLDNKLIDREDCVGDMAKKINTKAKFIYRVCQGKRSKHKNYKFSYEAKNITTA